MKTTHRQKFDQGAAIEQFERYKATGNGKMVFVKENFGGYSDAYAEGWSRILVKKIRRRKSKSRRCSRK